MSDVDISPEAVEEHATWRTDRATGAILRALRAALTAAEAERDALLAITREYDPQERAMLYRALGWAKDAASLDAAADMRERAARAVERHRFANDQMMIVGPGKHGFRAIRPTDAKDYLAAAIRALPLHVEKGGSDE